jgi:flagellar biosynthetic protein FliR
VLSLERFPPGQPWLLEPAAAALIHQAALAFALGLALVAPVVLCLFMVELGLGVVARNLPQVNMFTFGLPIKVLVGLAALAAWLGGASSIVSRSYASIFGSWEAMLR